jgi:hypothetical protein
VGSSSPGLRNHRQHRISSSFYSTPPPSQSATPSSTPCPRSRDDLVLVSSNTLHRREQKHLLGYGSLSLTCALDLISSCSCIPPCLFFYSSSATIIRSLAGPFSIILHHFIHLFRFLLHIWLYRRRHRPRLYDRDHEQTSSSYRSTLYPGIRSALELHQPCSTDYYPPPSVLSERRANTILFSQWLSTAASGAVFLFFCRTYCGLRGRRTPVLPPSHGDISLLIVYGTLSRRQIQSHILFYIKISFWNHFDHFLNTVETLTSI